jgi:hypothetical protein
MIHLEIRGAELLSKGQRTHNTKVLHRKLDTQDYDTLLLSLHTIYDHVVLETSWGAWAGAITAIEYLRRHFDKGNIIGTRMEPWILGQFASRQREIIGRGVLELQEDTANCVLLELRRYHHIQRDREEHLERKKKHIDNLAEVLQAMIHLDVQVNRWVRGYKVVAELMLLEDEGRPGRHADFHGGVQFICDPSTCRHTTDANDLFRALEEICTNLISEGQLVEAREATDVFERVPPYYKHIAAERLERVRGIWHDTHPSDQEWDDVDL